MILISSQKLSVDGVDVYPDHESKTQFWYIPGTVRLAQRGKRKALSYLWYTESATDNEGTGFLNFEVNTAVPQATLDNIKAKIRTDWAPSGTITLSTVPYHTGNVNFAVLGSGGVLSKAGNLAKDPSFIRSSSTQAVWQAGSSSLVGDNAAVCGVTFTKEGKLAGAMDAVLENRMQNIAAVYRLEYLAMRPAVTFSVKGTFKKTIDAFTGGIGVSVPLEALLLDVGIQAQWQRAVQNTDLKIEIIDYSDGDPNTKEALKWAQQILLEYVLKNFYEVDVAPGKWAPLSDVPAADQAVQKTKEIESAAAKKVKGSEEDSTPTEDKKPEDTEAGTTEDKDEGKDKDKEGAATDPKTEPEKDKKDETSSAPAPAPEPAPAPAPEPAPAPATMPAQDSAVKQLVSAAAPPIPKLSIRASYFRGEQINTIDYVFKESRAKSTVVLPQAVIGLDEDDKPDDYIVRINRSNNPFGRAYNVQVAIPDAEDRQKVGLQTLNVRAVYPAGAPKEKQSAPLTLTVDGTTSNGANPIPFQYNAKGDAGVEYSIDYVFKPGSEWEGEPYTYSVKGVSEKGLITAMPEAVAEFLKINVAMSDDYVWGDADQVRVTLTSRKWPQPRALVFNRDRKTEAMPPAQTLSLRSPIEHLHEPVTYGVEVLKRGKVIETRQPEPVVNKQVTVYDSYAEHAELTFVAGFTDDTAEMTLSYQDGDYTWTDEFTLEGGSKEKVKRVVPLKKPGTNITVTYEASFDSGKTSSGTAKTTGINRIKAPA